MKYLIRFLLCFSLFLTTACAQLSAKDSASTNTTTLTQKVETLHTQEFQPEPKQEPNELPQAASEPQAPKKPVLVPSAELRRLWDDVKQQNDITVLPDVPAVSLPESPIKETTPPPKKTHKAKDEKNSKVNVQLRKPTEKKPRKRAKSPVAPASVVKMPPAKAVKPVLTRRQILEREIGRERVALKAAQSQLNAAKKQGDSKKVNRLSNIIRDRELNIKAIEKEILR